MHVPRIDYSQVAPELARTLAGLHPLLQNSAVGEGLIDLIYHRVSQINGCGFCLDMHAHAARRNGESERRLHTLAGWREAPFFSGAERAALAWAEALTAIGTTHAPDELFTELRRHFSDREIVELTFAVAAINAWNRIAIGLRSVPPQPDASAWEEETPFAR